MPVPPATENKDHTKGNSARSAFTIAMMLAVGAGITYRTNELLALLILIVATGFFILGWRKVRS